MERGWGAIIGGVVAVASTAIAAATYFTSVREKDDLRVEVERTAHLPYLSEDGAFVLPTARRLMFTNQGNRMARVRDILFTLGVVDEFSSACGVRKPTIAKKYRVPATDIRPGEVTEIQLDEFDHDLRARKDDFGYFYLAAAFPELRKGQRIGGCLWFSGAAPGQKIAEKVPLYDFALGDGGTAARAAKADLEKGPSMSAVLIQRAWPW